MFTPLSAELQVLLLDLNAVQHVCCITFQCLPASHQPPCELHDQAGSALQDASHSSCGLQFCQSGAGLLPHVCVGVGGCWGRLGHLCCAIRLLWRHVLPHVEEGHTAAAGHGHNTRPVASFAHSAGQHYVIALQALWLLHETSVSCKCHVLCVEDMYLNLQQPRHCIWCAKRFAYWLTAVEVGEWTRLFEPVCCLWPRLSAS